MTCAVASSSSKRQGFNTAVVPLFVSGGSIVVWLQPTKKAYLPIQLQVWLCSGLKFVGRKHCKYIALIQKCRYLKLEMLILIRERPESLKREWNIKAIAAYLSLLDFVRDFWRQSLCIFIIPPSPFHFLPWALTAYVSSGNIVNVSGTF